MARVDLGWHEGRRRYKAVYGHTRREVADKLTKLLRDTQQGIPLGDDRHTLRQYLDHWLAAITNSVRPKPGFPSSPWYRTHRINRRVLSLQGSDARSRTTEGDTWWVKKKTVRFSSHSTAC